MRANVKRGTGFRGVLSYALGKGAAAAIVGGNMSGRTISALSREFGVSRARRPEIKRAVWHGTLSLPPGERASGATWAAIGEAHMRNVGMDPARHMFVVVRHSDTPLDHAHIIASRVALDGVTARFAQNRTLSGQG